MKKIYLNPTTDVVMVNTQQMIAASTELFGEDATGPGMSHFLDDDGGDFLFDEEELFRFE